MPSARAAGAAPAWNVPCATPPAAAPSVFKAHDCCVCPGRTQKPTSPFRLCAPTEEGPTRRQSRRPEPSAACVPATPCGTTSEPPGEHSTVTAEAQVALVSERGRRQRPRARQAPRCRGGVGGGARLATRDRPGALLRPHGASPALPGPRGQDAAVGAAAAARGPRAPPAGSLEVPRGPLLGSPIRMITRPFPSVEMKWGPWGAPPARPAPTPAALFRDAGLEHRTQWLPG